MSQIDLIRAKLSEWRFDANLFAWECFGFEPDNWQRLFLEYLVDPKRQRIALKAAKGPGKTAVEAIAIWWFLACLGEKGSHPKGAATSISEKNLKDNLWTELAKWRNRSTFIKKQFIWTRERIFAKDHPETWFISARTWSKSGDATQQANTLAGGHGDYMLYVLDESGGIPTAVMATAEGGLTGGKWCKIIQAGNPTHNEGPLYLACTQEAHLWSIINITGDPDDPDRSKRISIQWAKEQIEKYGRDNPWVLVNVFNKFPPTSINSLLAPDEVNAAMRRNIAGQDYQFSQRRIGVDVARFGSDKTVLFPRQGLQAFQPIDMRNARTDEIAARVSLAKSKWGSDAEFVDDTGGYGAGVIDCLIQTGNPPIGINFSGKAIDPRYYNKRSEMWFLMADWVKKGGSLPKIPELIGELTTPTYTFHNGKLRVEEKEHIKSRLGRSPDLGDALALTFALPDMARDGDLPLSLRTSSRYVSDYNPFADDRL